MKKLLNAAVGICGLLAAMYGGWFVVKAPFFGYPLPPVELIPVAAAGFVAGVMVFAWGASTATGLRDSPDRALSEGDHPGPDPRSD